jgi:PII-like signaling protein
MQPALRRLNLQNSCVEYRTFALKGYIYVLHALRPYARCRKRRWACEGVASSSASRLLGRPKRPAFPPARAAFAGALGARASAGNRTARSATIFACVAARSVTREPETVTQMMNDLPLVTEFIATDEKIGQFLPVIGYMMGRGLITLEADGLPVWRRLTFSCHSRKTISSGLSRGGIPVPAEPARDQVIDGDCARPAAD